MARSPYFEAKINRWCDGKKELMIDDCDITTFNIITAIVFYIWTQLLHLPGNLMCRNENVLATGAEVIDPTTSDVVVNQELALVGPFLSVFGCT